MPTKNYCTLPILAVSGIALLCADLALAQQAQLDEIVVTARKREENLQEVPMSVTAIDAAQIERLGIRDLADVTRYTPGVTLDKGFGLNDQRLVIRGLSPSRGRPNSAILVDGIDLTTESVSTPGGSILINQRLLDVQQVEVVKGPQSALYGRAAFAGAISYVTRDPGEELETEVGVDVGEYGRRYLRAAIGGPISDSFGLRLNGLAWNEDGYYQEGFTGANLGGGSGYGLSLTGKWDSGNVFSARARVAYSDDEYDQQATFYDPVNTIIPVPDDAENVVDPNAVVGLFSGMPAGADGRTSYLTPRPEENDIPAERSPYEGGFAEVLNTSLKLDWDLGVGSISSYTGYANANSGQIFDADFDVRPDATLIEDIARGGSFVDFDTDTRLLSQEIRYTSNLDGPVQFIAGALYWDEDVKQVETGVSVLAIPPWPGSTPEGYYNTVVPITNIIPHNVNRDTNSRSIYGMLDWNLTEQLTLSLEARYAREEMDVTGTGCDRSNTAGFFLCPFATPDISFPTGAGGFSQLQRVVTIDSKSDYYLAPKAVIEWTPFEDFMSYFSVSQGVKPGGIATVASGTFMDQTSDGNLDELKFENETLTAFEVGGKSTLFDRRVILNGAIFYQKFDDKQIAVQQLVGNNIATTIENASKATVRGLELEATWLVTDNTRLQVGYARLNAQYDEIVYETNSTNSIARAGNCIPDATEDNCEINLSGNRMEDVPDHSLVALAGWYPPLGGNGLSGLLEADVQYEDKRFIDEFNDREVDSYSLLNMRVGLQADRWDALLYVNNALDDDTIKSWSAGTGIVATAERFRQDLAIFPPEGFSIAPPPRQWGVRANFRF